VRVCRKGTSDPDFDVSLSIDSSVLVLKTMISAFSGVEVHHQRLMLLHPDPHSHPNEVISRSACNPLNNSLSLRTIALGRNVSVLLAEVGEEAQYEGSTAGAERMRESAAAPPPAISRIDPLRSNSVDVVFSFDTTGSMYAKLAEVRKSLMDTVSALLTAVPNVHFGVIAHGDYCDSYSRYALRRFDLCADSKAVCTFISTVAGTDGGDYPECYELALREARLMRWRAAARKVLVVVGDSEPHPPSYTDQDIYWRDEVCKLRDMGVKIYAVRVSGDDTTGTGDRATASFWAEMARLTGGVALDHVSNLSFLAKMLTVFCGEEEEADKAKGEMIDVRVVATSDEALSGAQRKLAEDLEPADESVSYWTRDQDNGRIAYWYDIRWNKWNPRPIGHRFHLPRYQIDQKCWQLIIAHIAQTNPRMLQALSLTCQTLLRCATWRVEFSLEYYTRPGEEVYIIGHSPSLGSWNMEIKNKMLWTAGHIWRLTKRILPGSSFFYKYAVRYPNGIVRIEPQPRLWSRTATDEYASQAFLTGRTVLIRDYYEFPPLLTRNLGLNGPDEDSIFDLEMTDNSIERELEVLATPEFKTVTCEETKLLSIVHLRAPASLDTAQRRVATDLVAVIDISGSMAGSKLASVQSTLKFIVNNMMSHDRLCLITFDNNVYRLTRLQRMDQQTKEIYTCIIDMILPRNCTDILSALTCAVEVLRVRRSCNPVTAIMLLTDGDDNSGPRRLSRETAREVMNSLTTPCSLYTFGFGHDHNATILSQVAEVGKGMFYYIQDTTKVREAFGNCLGGLLSLYAQDVLIALKPVGGASIAGVKTSFPKSESKTFTTVQVPDLFSEESRDIPVVLKLPKSLPSESPFCYLEVTVESTIAVLQTRARQNALMNVRRVVDTTKDKPNVDVDLQRNRVVVAEAIELAVTAANQGKFEEARKVLLSAQLSVKNSFTANNPVSLQLLSDIAKSIEAVRTQTNFTTGGHHFMQQQQQSHWLQRATIDSSLYHNVSQTTHSKS